jgi:hypothetical protein
MTAAPVLEIEAQDDAVRVRLITDGWIDVT